MIQAYKCSKYDIVRPIDILVQRETITVGEKINIVRPDFFSVDSIQNIRIEKCGEFCIAFINYVNNTSEYERFINMFSDSKMYLNDFIVHNLIKKI